MTDQQHEPPAADLPQPQPEQDPHLEAAAAEEQALMDRAMQIAQAQYLFDRVVRLNAQARRLAQSESADGSQPGV